MPDLLTTLRRRSGRATAGLILTGALAVAACGGAASSTSTAKSQVVVGLITKTETNPFFVKMKQGAQKEADAKGAKLLTAAGQFDGDNASQVTAIENMVAAGAKGILITPSDTKAIVPSIQKARSKGVLVIALDTPTDPQSAVDALFATDNLQAGTLIGKYAKAVEGTKAVDTQGDQAKGQTAMENCLQKAPDINLVYTINEPAAFGAYTALKAAGKEKDVLIVSVDGGCTGVRGVKAGQIAATSQQYPLKMASRGVDAVVNFAQTGKKVSGYTDTGVTLVTDNPQTGIPSQDTQFGLANCWG
jgi:fructose transport system substrate-binding protein